MNVVEILDKRYILVPEEEFLNGVSNKKFEAIEVIRALSPSELNATKYLFKQLKITDIIISTKIASEIGIAKSAFTVTLRKLEIGNILKATSLGRKGVKINVINKYFDSELSKF